MNLKRVLTHNLTLQRTTGVDANGDRAFAPDLLTAKCRVVRHERTTIDIAGEKRTTSFRFATEIEVFRGDRVWFTDQDFGSMDPNDPEQPGLDVVEVKTADTFNGRTKLSEARC